MSRAFVREADGSDDVHSAPERLVSEHANYVTETGLALIEDEIARLTEALSQAQASADRVALSTVGRDLRYWLARRASADVIPPPTDTNAVQFGSVVSVVRDDGRRQTFRITGEDEADPAKGSISYVSPLARALMGKSAGDSVRLGPGMVEILAVG